MVFTEEFSRFVCDQISGAGSAQYRKMFGEYGIYCSCICDNTLFVKIIGGGKQLRPHADTAYPYEGSKTPSFRITKLEDSKLQEQLIRTTCEKLQKPKSRK